MIALEIEGLSTLNARGEELRIVLPFTKSPVLQSA